MCQKFGYSIKWSIHSLKHILKRIYRISLTKLIATANKYYDKPVKLWFSDSQDDVNILI